MSDKYSKEIQVCNLLLSYLKNDKQTIIQLISPGAQATYSLSYLSTKSGKSKTVFPDLISLKENKIYVGEIKPKFSESDKEKLLDIAESSNGIKKIKDLVSRILKLDVSEHQIVFILIHGELPVKEDNQISQLILTEEETILQIK